MAEKYNNWTEEIQHDLLNLREKIESQINALDSSLRRPKRDTNNCWEDTNADDFMEFQNKILAKEEALNELITLIEQIELMEKIIHKMAHSYDYHYPVFSDSELLLQEIQSCCQKFSEEIVTKICKRSIKTINSWGRNYIGFGEDYPTKFTVFDILSIELQSKYYEELNPFLQDAIYGALENQYNSISSIESFILDYSVCFDNDGIDKEAIQNKILEKLNELLNEHYQLKKIQNFEEKRIW